MRIFRFAIAKVVSLFAITLLSSGNLLAQVGELPRSSPEAQGVQSSHVAAFIDSVMAIHEAEIHHIVLLRHGSVIADFHPSPFLPADGHTLFSCSKTFAAAAVGIAEGEGLLSVSDPVISFFPNELPDSVSPWLASLTVRDLLTMQSGIVPTDSVRQNSTRWVRDLLALPVTAKPGERFAYDSMCTYLLSAIVGRVSGASLLEYLRPRLFEPLGISELNWETSPEGESCGGWGLYLQAESMAKFGQCLLQKGRYAGRQLIPAQWVGDMMTVHVQECGYGYQMWACAQPGSMRADGAYGQFIIVMPQEDMVCVITQCITAAAPGNREQAFLFNLVCHSLSSTPLPESHDSKALQRKLAKYSHPTPQGESTSRRLKKGQALTVTLAPNRMGWKSLSISQSAKKLTMTVTDSLDRQVPIPCAHSSWAMSQVPTTFPPHPRGSTLNSFSGFDKPFKVAASYGWLSYDELDVRLLFTNWISGIDMKIRLLENGEASVTVMRNFDKSSFNVTASWL